METERDNSEEANILYLAKLRAENPFRDQRKAEAPVRDEPLAFYDTVNDVVSDFNKQNPNQNLTPVLPVPSGRG